MSAFEILHELKCSCDPTQKPAGDNDLGNLLFGPRQCNYHIVITQYKRATCKRQDCLQHLISKRIINQCNYLNPFSMKNSEKLPDPLPDWTILDLSKCVHPIPALEIKKYTFRNTPANQYSQYSSPARENPMKEKSSYPSELPPSYDSAFGNYVDKGSNKKQKVHESKLEKASPTEAWLFATSNFSYSNNIYVMLCIYIQSHTHDSLI